MIEVERNFPLQDEDIRIMPFKQENNCWHEHDCLELVYVVRGSGIHYIDNLIYDIKEGDCFVIDFGSRHRYETHKNEPFDIVNIIFYPEIIDKSLKGCHSFREMAANYLIMLNPLDCSQLEYICFDSSMEIRLLVQRLCDEYFGENHGRLQMLRCLLIELIITLMRTLTENFSSPDRHESTKYLLQYVDKNYMKPICLGDLAQHMNFSLSYISKCFHADMGQTFTKYLHHIRIQQSCRLLANTNYKIANIAELCGFGDIKWFNMQFKSAMGITPSQYRVQKK